MALPAIRLLAGHGRVVVAAPRWGAELYRGLGVLVVDRDQSRQQAAEAELAVLLKPSLSAAWQARGAARRVGLPTDHRRLLLTDVVEPVEEHRAQGLLRVAATAASLPMPDDAWPGFQTSAQDAAGLPTDLPPGFVLLLPGTASTETVAWRGFAELAAGLGARAIATGGPGDEAAAAATGARVLPPPSLAGLAWLATQAAAVVGNDSGLPHLATAARRAAGVDPADVHVVYASTDPARTGPPGSRPWPGPRPPCWPCYAKRCDIGAPCRDAAPGPLLAAIEGPG